MRRPAFDVEVVAPLPLGDVQERRGLDDAGVADRDVERIDLVEGALDRVAIAHVDLVVGHRTQGAELGHDGIDPGGRTDVGEHDRGAAAQQLRRHGAADVACAARDDRPATGQLHVFAHAARLLRYDPAGVR
jgi:hypothetical protein